MGSRKTVVWCAVAAALLSSACAGRSIRERDGDSGAGGEPERAGTGGNRGGSTSRGGTDASSSGGTTPRGGTDSPPLNGSGGAGATSPTGGTTSATGGSTSPGRGGSTSASGGAGTGTGVDPSSEAGAAGAGHAFSESVTLVPDATGWIDLTVPNNSVGIQGGWYAFGDRYGDATCVDAGLHVASECALITSPDPLSGTFPNVDGAMHTEGIAEKILPCVAGITTTGCPEHDYANMWGAGIGLDFLLDDAGPHVWRAAQHHVVGIRFFIDNVPVSGLRVEFPTLLTDDEAAATSPPLPPGSSTDDVYVGAPYWGAQAHGDGKFPSSPVQAGENVIFWDDIESPVLSAYRFSEDRLLGIRFHVPTNSASAQSYSFTISNLTFLR